MAAEGTADERLLDFDIHSLSGESVGHVSIGAAALARKLVERVRVLLGNPRGIVRLLHGTQTLAESVLVVEQIPPGVSSIQCLVVPVDEEQTRQVAHSVLSGETLGEGGWQVWDCVERLEGVRHQTGVTLPSALRSISFAHGFNDGLADVALPSGLQSVAFGRCFNQSLADVALPSGLQSITFGHCFNQSLASVALPSSLKSIVFGDRFNKSLERVALPDSLQTIAFGGYFDQSLAGVTLPSGLRSIRLPRPCRLHLEGAELPPSVEVFRD